MADSNIFYKAALGIRNEWGLQLPATLSEEALLQLLAARLAQIITQGGDHFYQLMYRLDIPEKKLNALCGDDNVAYKVAQLVYQRQLQKIQSRKDNRMDRDDSDPDLKW